MTKAWAFVGPNDLWTPGGMNAQVDGSDAGAVQFRDTDYTVTGTNTFTFTTASLDDHQLRLTGSMHISGGIYASTFNVVTVTTTNSTGSTIFGNKSDNTHEFTGSVGMAGAASGTPTFYTNSTLYKVGMGTASPTHLLTVAGDISGSGKIFNEGGIETAGTLGVTGSVTIIGHLSGTSADFAGSVAVGADLNVSGNTNVSDLYVGDDLLLTSDGAILKFGADNDATITHDGGNGLNFAIAGSCEFDSTEGSLMFGNAMGSGQTLKLGNAGAVQVTIAPHDTAGSELFSVINTAGTTDGTDAAGAILLSSVAGGIGLAWADDKDLWAEGGQIMMVANHDAADAIKLHADAGTSQTITVVNDAGTSAAAIGLTATAGGVTITSAATTAQPAITVTAAQTTKDVFEIAADAVTTANVINVTADALTTGKILNLVSDSSNTDANTLALIHNDHASAVNTTALHIKNDAIAAAGTVLIETTAAETNPILELRNSNAATDKPVILAFNRSDTSAEADDMSLATIRFDGVDAGNAATAYASIDATASDITAGDEGGKLTFSVFAGGTAGTAAAANLLSIGGEDVANATQCAVVVNDAGIDNDFRVESATTTTALVVEGSTGFVGVGTATALDSALTVTSDRASKGVSTFFHDGNNANRYGIIIAAGLDDQSSGDNAHVICYNGAFNAVSGYLGKFSGTFAAVDPSDRRIKKNIKDTKVKGLETVNAMKIRDFQLKESKSNFKKTGFIAQELETVYPAAVYNPGPDKLDVAGNPMMMGVAKDNLIPVLVKAVQELSAEVEELKRKINDG